MRIATTGGRDFNNRRFLHDSMDMLVRWFGSGIQFAHGACHLGGADALVDEWYCSRFDGPPLARYPVSEIDGPWPAAGPRRNRRMLDDFDPDLVVRFPGGSGTLDCCHAAHDRGIPVLAFSPGKFDAQRKAGW